MKKLVVLLAVIVATAVLFTGCGGVAEIARPQPSAGATVFNVEGSCDAVLNGTVVTVSGTTNLMDGTNGVISILNSDGTTVEEYKFTKSGDTMSHDFTIAADWPDTVYGFISFDTKQADKQPDTVIAAYGKKFENLQGDNVIWDLKGVIAVFQSEPVTISH